MALREGVVAPSRALASLYEEELPLIGYYG